MLTIDTYQINKSIKMIHKAIHENEGCKKTVFDAYPIEFNLDDLDADATFNDCKFGVKVLIFILLTYF